MCFTYDSYCDAYTERVRKARKPHVCEGCARGIAVGETYTHVSGIFEGDPFTSRVCGACELDRYIIYLRELGEGCGWQEAWIAPGDLHDYRHEHEMQQSSREDGQRYFDLRRQRFEISQSIAV
jgi:hypothetical protein